MDYRIFVSDSTTYRAIQNAVVSFLDPSGSRLATFRTDSGGFVNISADTDGGLVVPGHFVNISSPGYFDATFPISERWNFDEFLELTPKLSLGKQSVKPILLLTALGIVGFIVYRATK